MIGKERIKMKVFSISPMYPNAKNPGFGCFIEQIENALSSNYSVQFVHGVRFKSKESKLAKSISYACWTIRTLWIGLSKRYDIIHAHTVFPAGAIALLIGVLRHKPYILTVHGSDICQIGNRNIGIQWLARKALNRASEIQAVSYFIKNKVIEFLPLSAKKIFVQCMGVDITLFRPSTELYVRKSTVNLIFVGNLVDQKGWREAFQTINELLNLGVDCCLDVFGDGVDKPLAEDWVARNGLELSIKLHGAKPRQIIACAMQDADVLIFPTKYEEAFSLVTAEALACDVSVVVSDRGAMIELVAGIEGSFAVSKLEDIGTLADCCLKSINFRKNKIGKPRLSQLSNKYSLKTSASKTMLIYQKIMNRK